jgi:hypothetical protein
MRHTNLFVKVTITIPFDEIHPMLASNRIPIMELQQDRVNRFKSFVMSHEIIKCTKKETTPRTFVLLHRDLDVFCEGLANLHFMIEQHDKLVSHIVSIVDIFENQPNATDSYTGKFQEMLIAPYRARLRGFPRFAINGAISKELSAAAVAEITRPKSEDPDVVLAELEELKAKGNEVFRQGDVRIASEHWSDALSKIYQHMSSSKAEQLRQAGGPVFVNRLHAIYFDLCSNRAQAQIKGMRDCSRYHPQLVPSFGELLLLAVEGARGPGDIDKLFPSSTWQPSSQQLAKVMYREAVGCRLMGEARFVAQAENAIDEAIHLVPSDAELRREKERISVWKRWV